MPGTHGSFKALIAKGFSENQAEGIIEVMHHKGMDYATKADLKETETLLRSDLKETETLLKLDLERETATLRSELKEEAASLRSELKETENILRSEMQQMETRLTKLIYVNTFAIIGIMSAVISIATAIGKIL